MTRKSMLKGKSIANQWRLIGPRKTGKSANSTAVGSELFYPTAPVKSGPAFLPWSICNGILTLPFQFVIHMAIRDPPVTQIWAFSCLVYRLFRQADFSFHLRPQPHKSLFHFNSSSSDTPQSFMLLCCEQAVPLARMPFCLFTRLTQLSITLWKPSWTPPGLSFHYTFILITGSQSVETQIFGPHPRSPESEILGLGPNNLYFNKPSKWVWCTHTSENHWFWHHCVCNCSLAFLFLSQSVSSLRVGTPKTRTEGGREVAQ